MNEVTGFLLIVNILLIIVRLHRLENVVFNKKKDGEQNENLHERWNEGNNKQ